MRSFSSLRFPVSLWLLFLGGLPAGAQLYLGSPTGTSLPNFAQRGTYDGSYGNPYGRNHSYNPNYNFEWGPIDYSLNASLTATFNDNINLSSTHPETDITLAPFAGLQAEWDYSEDNQAQVNLGVGYLSYILHPENDSIIIAPNSKADFSFDAGEFRFDLHEGFSYQQDPTLVPQVSNTSNFPIATNDAGVTVIYLGTDAVQLIFNYDHTNQFVFDNQYRYLDFNEDLVSPQVAWTMSDQLVVGLSAQAAYTYYDQAVENDNKTLQAGPYVSYHFNRDFSLYATAGYSVGIYAKGGSVNDNSNNNSFYANVSSNYQIDPYWNVQASVGRDTIGGLNSNYTQRVYAQGSVTWFATQHLTVSPTALFETLDDSEAQVSQSSDHYQVGLNANYGLTSHLNLNASYLYTLKTSSLPDSGYRQNLISVGLNYQF